MTDEVKFLIRVLESWLWSYIGDVRTSIFLYSFFSELLIWVGAVVYRRDPHWAFDCTQAVCNGLRIPNPTIHTTRSFGYSVLVLFAESLVCGGWTILFAASYWHKGTIFSANVNAVRKTLFATMCWEPWNEQTGGDCRALIFVVFAQRMVYPSAEFLKLSHWVRVVYHCVLITIHLLRQFSGRLTWIFG